MGLCSVQNHKTWNKRRSSLKETFSPKWIRFCFIKMSFNFLCVYVKCTKWLGCETYVIAQKLLSSTHVWGEVSSHNAILPDFLICVFCAGNHIFKYSIKYVSKNLCFLSTEFLMNKKKYLWNLNAPSTYWVIRFCHVCGILQFFTAAHSSGCLNDRIAWFCHKTNFFQFRENLFCYLPWTIGLGFST